MPTRSASVPAVFILSLLTAACGGSPEAGASESRSQRPMELVPCAAAGVLDALCGSLTVLEDPGAPDGEGRTIDLAVTVLPATGPEGDRAADPIFALHGGPGAAARFLAPIFASLPVRDRRDIVLVDQRGTGESNGMVCGTENAGSWMMSVLRFEFDPEACPDFDADPRFYTTPIAMDDLDAVRQALGIEEVNLWGGSYGSRAALVYLRRHPSRVRSVVLDGVAPLSVKVPSNFPVTSQAALDLLLEDCSADPGCAGRGDLSGMLDATLARLEADPASVTFPFPGEAEPVTLTLGRSEFAATLLYALYSPFTAAVVPAAIAAAHQGNYAPAATLGAAFAAGTRPAFSTGMTLSVLCAEDVPYFTETEMDAEAAGTFLGEGFADGLHEACAAWPSGSVPGGYHDPVTAQVPTLILSGQGDPVTPPRFAQEVTGRLTPSLHLVFPDMGHGQTGTACGGQLVSAFVEAGSPEGLDTSCVSRVRRPPFTP